jgi:hypothetical protein
MSDTSPIVSDTPTIVSDTPTIGRDTPTIGRDTPTIAADPPTIGRGSPTIGNNPENRECGVFVLFRLSTVRGGGAQSWKSLRGVRNSFENN